MSGKPTDKGSAPHDPSAPQFYHTLFHVSGDNPEEQRVAHALEAIAGALCRLDSRIAEVVTLLGKK